RTPLLLPARGRGNPPGKHEGFMMARYRFDPPRSRFTVQAFATGWLAAFAHSPTFAVRDFAGTIHFRADPVEDWGLDVTVPTEHLGWEGGLPAADRREIETRMRGEVLETARCPEIRFQSAEVRVAPASQERYQLQIVGRLSLHGVTLPHQVVAEL